MKLMKTEDLTGKRFERLVVIEKVGKTNRGSTLWKCQCDCGTVKLVVHAKLTSGNTKSCGCWRAEKFHHTTHGLGKPPTYGVWVNMKTRCYNTKTHNYNAYGERGIEVCDEWRNSFKEFHDWAMTHGYKSGLTLDRIDVNGDYCPENCRWVTLEVQGNNRRDNRFIEYGGKRQTISQWARELGMNYDTLRNRITNGWSVEDALTKEVKH
jgi:hypothetical protein